MNDDQESNNPTDAAASPSELRAFAAHLKEQIAIMSQAVRVRLSNLDGSTREVTLTDAPQYAVVGPAALRAARASVALDAKLREHDHQSLSKARAEPETVREWFAALVSGKFAVAMAAGAGAAALRLLQIALIAGLIGLSVHAAGTSALIEHAKNIELGLLAQSNEAELARPASAPAQESPDCSSSPAACADDATTIARLRVVFRTSAAQALQREIAALGHAGAGMRHEAYELGAVDARRAILAQAERPAAPSLDPRAEPHHFQASVPPEPLPAHDVIDDAFKRRVETLRANEPTWRRLRAWAVHPVSADYAGEAFLRTAMGDLSAPQAHALRVWSEQMSTQFAGELVRGHDPMKSAHALATRRVEMPLHSVTARDQRLFRDFSAGVPERVSTEFTAYNTGMKDPGSLGRAFATGSHSAAPNMYSELFPSIASSPPHTPATHPGSVGHAPVSANRMPSARSYARVRFSGRIGGVVFGRPAEPGGQPADVVGLEWSMRENNQIVLSVRMRDSSVVKLGPYHPAIVHHALAFVADGRVVVTTLPQPFKEPGQLFAVPARRVVVHPAFEDTAFACNAIQIDRFVDTFTQPRKGASMSQRVQRLNSTRLGVSYLGAMLASPEPLRDSEVREVLPAIQAYARSCKDDDKCFPLKRYHDLGVDFGSASSFIDCLRSSRSDAQSCVSELERNRTGNAYSVDSGVRERPYKIDPQLRFVSGVGQQDDKLWPIEFIIQAVPHVTGESEVAVSESQDPWQFPAISDDVQAVVMQGIAADPNAREVFRNVRDFVALQRFFRTALQAELGESFPLDALVKLSTDTKPYVKVRRHERWNVNASFIEFAYAVRAYVLKELASARPRMESASSCRRQVDKLLAPSGKAARSGFWQTFANLDADCADEPGVQNIIRIQQELRRQEVIGQMLELEQMKPSSTAAFACAAL